MEHVQARLLHGDKGKVCWVSREREERERERRRERKRRDQDRLYNFHIHLTHLNNSLKTLEAHGCKTWVTQLSISPHTLAVFATSIIAMHTKAHRILPHSDVHETPSASQNVLLLTWHTLMVYMYTAFDCFPV